MSGIYHTIEADPPWKISGGKNGKKGWSKRASPDTHYSLMKTEDICALPIAERVAAEDCHLYLWVVNNLLPDGLKVMEAWGFRYVTNLAWHKNDDKLGLGQYFRTKHELLLFGVRGRIPYARDPVTGKRIQPETLFSAPRGRHSEKPAVAHEIMELVSPGPRVELFARRPRAGWDSWGNELQSSFDLVAPVRSGGESIVIG